MHTAFPNLILSHLKLDKNFYIIVDTKLVTETDILVAKYVKNSAFPLIE